MQPGQWFGIIAGAIIFTAWLTFMGVAAFKPRALQRFQLAALDRLGVPRQSWRARIVTSRWYVWQLRFAGFGSLIALIGWLAYVRLRAH